jgi:ABC-type sugar transport system ATPase subunit
MNARLKRNFFSKSNSNIKEDVNISLVGPIGCGKSGKILNFKIIFKFTLLN